MKRKYTTPSLTVHGNIEVLTQALGDAPVSDSIIVNGRPIGAQTDGSADFEVS